MTEPTAVEPAGDDTAAPITATAPAPSPPGRPRWLLPVIAGAAGVVLFGAGLGVGALVFGGDSGGSSVKGTFSGSGTLTLSETDLGGITNLSGSGCSGYGGYSDITEGAQVTVTDETGATIGVGQLGAQGLGVLDLAVI